MYSQEVREFSTIYCVVEEKKGMKTILKRILGVAMAFVLCASNIIVSSPVGAYAAEETVISKITINFNGNFAVGKSVGKCIEF